MTARTPIAIVGAGPYGLGLAAHLRARGIEHRVFGQPMQSWATRMPKGMFLKSEGFASDLYEPARRHSLQRFCAENGLEYGEYNCPVPLDTFVDYGRTFQRNVVPHLESKSVAKLDRSPDGFAIELEDGEQLTADRVVIATGITYFRHIPPDLAHLPPEMLSHSADHYDLSHLKGRDVSVVGGGASALDLVAALRGVGAEVRLIARRPKLRWNTPVYRPGWKRWYPISGLGGGWQNRFYEYAPALFRKLPLEKRVEIVRTWLGPAGAYPVRETVEATPQLLGHTVSAARMNGSRVYLRVAGDDGVERDVPTEHVVAATGYKVDLRRLSFMDEKLRTAPQAVDQTPVLSPDFQSSVPGLYFIGMAAANAFGPVMRFLLGARYTARRLTRHFADGSARP
jgi:thioredoxin reductase